MVVDNVLSEPAAAEVLEAVSALAELEELEPVPEPELEPEALVAVPGRLTVESLARAWKLARERVTFAAVLGVC